MSAAEPFERSIARWLQQIGDRMGSLRRGKRITQDALAEALGVERKTISRWENGHHPMTVVEVKRIADALKVDPACFFTDNWDALGDSHRPLDGRRGVQGG